MKLTKLIIIFVLAFAVSVSAQENPYPNELEGVELFKNGEWKSLKPFISTKEDVEKIFSKDCINGCDYNEIWRIEIMYVGQCWSYSKREKRTVPKVAEEMVSKYFGISFYPKRKVKLSKFKFGKAFIKSGGGASHSSPSEWYSYDDSFGLSYQFSAVDTEDGKYRKDDLVSVTYGSSDSEYEKYANRVDCLR